MLVRLIAFLLIAESACATGLWLNGQEQIASSSSVVTNAGVIVTNNFTSDPTTNGWSFNDISSNASYDITWDASQSNIFISHVGGSSGVRAAPAYSSQYVFAVGVYTMSVTRAQDAWSFQMYALLGTQYVKLGIQDHFYTSGNGGFTGTVEGVFTGSWNRIGCGFNGGGAITARVFSVAVSGPSITTNSGSGASGPTLDGIVPLSTNRHTYLNGVRQ